MYRICLQQILKSTIFPESFVQSTTWPFVMKIVHKMLHNPRIQCRVVHRFLNAANSPTHILLFRSHCIELFLQIPVGFPVSIGIPIWGCKKIWYWQTGVYQDDTFIGLTDVCAKLDTWDFLILYTADSLIHRLFHFLHFVHDNISKLLEPHLPIMQRAYIWHAVLIQCSVMTCSRVYCQS